MSRRMELNKNVPLSCGSSFDISNFKILFQKCKGTKQETISTPSHMDVAIRKPECRTYDGRRLTWPFTGTPKDEEAAISDRLPANLVLCIAT